MNETKLQKYKNILEEEKVIITQELTPIAIQDPQNPSDWIAKGSDVNERSADPNKLADNLEEDLTNDGVIHNLSDRLRDINEALEKIESGTYGKCEVSGEQIEEGRLDANPAARTCIEHMNQ